MATPSSANHPLKIPKHQLSVHVYPVVDTPWYVGPTPQAQRTSSENVQMETGTAPPHFPLESTVHQPI